MSGASGRRRAAPGRRGQESNRRPCGRKMLTGGARHRQCFLRVKPVTIFAPAKLNLFLAVTGRRADGFHDLVSVAAPLDFGDTLVVEARGEGQGANGNFSLTCNDEAVPCDESNLVLKAARAFAIATGWRGGANFSLEKQIP